MGSRNIIVALTLSVFLSISAPAISFASLYEYDPGSNIRWNERNGDFTFGKAEFDAVGFNAPEGSDIKLIIRHKLNDNDADEQWGVWFYDSGTGRIIQTKRDPYHLLETSVDENGDGIWTNTGFTLLKPSITDVLYSNVNDWQFIIHEITDDTINSFVFNRARLVVASPTPIPGAGWLLGTALAVLMVGFRKRRG